MGKYIYVKGVGAKDTVALWERHPLHPNGEVFIKGEETAQVGVTPEVNKRLRKGTLVKVSGKAAADEQEEEAEEEEGSKPRIANSVASAGNPGGPVANVTAGPAAAPEMAPARGKALGGKQ